MNVLDLFSGIGGFSLGLERAGMRTVAFCEIEPYASEVLARRFPGVSNIGDVRQTKFCPAQVITAGFPCQDISLAGKRAGISGARSGLYREVVRAVRLVRPRYVIMENVAALLNSGMGRVLGDMAENGYDAEWDCISASDVGAPHGRDRVWITFTNPDKLERAHGRGKAAGWWKWLKKEIAAARNPNGQWQLQPPRLLGDIRRRVDNAARSGTWWVGDWQAKFEALRGMDDGIPGGLDRAGEAAAIRTLGNTVLPQIPEIIGRAIMTSTSSGAQRRGSHTP